MDATFGHPLWISSGIVLMVVGFLLFRWARSFDVSGEIANATRESALKKLLKSSKSPDGEAVSKQQASNNFRRAMSQLFGIIGFLMIVAGLMSLLLGIFYPVGQGY